MDIPFTRSDIWLFLSIGLADPPADLANVLLRGDALNKAMMSPQEVRRGLSKLSQAGLAIDSAGIYSLTEKGLELIDNAGARRQGFLAAQSDLAKHLCVIHGPNDDPRFDDPRFPYPQLSDEILQGAYREAYRRFQDINKRVVSDVNRKKGRSTDA